MLEDHRRGAGDVESFWAAYAQMISFIVPAHNEEAWIGRCVSAIRSGLESVDEPHETIVVLFQ